MADERSTVEKILWNLVGEPLYYCKECLRVVHVETKDGEVIIKRNCSHENSEVIAPRKSILSGKGYAGLTMGQKAKVTFQQVAAKITGRNV